MKEIDVQRALDDFDGDADSVAEVLVVFLEDMDMSLSVLDDGPKQGRLGFASILHELANSLESVWCFSAGRRVRAAEVQCRGDEPVAMGIIQQQVRHLLLATAEEATYWLRDHAAR